MITSIAPIISSGEIKESATLCLLLWKRTLYCWGGNQTCEELLCDQHIMNSNTTSYGIIEYVDYDAEEDDDTPLPIVAHDKAPIIDNDNNVLASYGVLISDNATAGHTNNNNKCGISYYGYRGYNVTSINDDGRTQNRREINYGEKDGSGITTNIVDMDDLFQRLSLVK